MTSEERAKSFCVGLGYFAGSIAEAELRAILDEHEAKVKAEQRQMCADKVSILAESLEILSKDGIQAFEDACLDATGESDDK